MAEKKQETVILIAPNGVPVSVDASKRAARLAGGYQLPAKRTADRSGKANK